jgi:hypothetical protein
MTTYEKTRRWVKIVLGQFSAAGVDRPALNHLTVRVHPDDFRGLWLAVHPDDPPIPEDCELLMHGVRVIPCSDVERL